MTAPLSRRQFVDALAEVALDRVVDGEVAALNRPPGRKPRPDLVARSDWFGGLKDEDREFAVDLMRSTAYGVLHTVLCVLDGVAAIEDGPSKGRLRLLHDTTTDVVDLTDPTGDSDLHDLLAERFGR